MLAVVALTSSAAEAPAVEAVPTVAFTLFTPLPTQPAVGETAVMTTARPAGGHDARPNGVPSSKR